MRVAFQLFTRRVVCHAGKQKRDPFAGPFSQLFGIEQRYLFTS
jgi:hypothetical protein